LSEVGLQEGDAIIWYLDHSGWAIRTKSRLLIFDYFERTPRPVKPSLDSGFISATQIKDLKVMVFVSHSHADHNDPYIFDWETVVADITYIFGWEAKEGPNYVTCEYKREDLNVDGVQIQTVVHDFDGIPESAFLVKVDGLVIFHSGDHGNGPPPFKEPFANNIEYLAEIAPKIDLAFIPLFGEQFYVAEKLKAKYTFPMHSEPDQYREFAEHVAERGLKTKVLAAESRGQKFLYKNGVVR
jgi:L-ascorbate metabolism protein UlaG (beta-lactamase superfamily)